MIAQVVTKPGGTVDCFLWYMGEQSKRRFTEITPDHYAAQMCAGMVGGLSYSVANVDFNLAQFGTGSGNATMCTGAVFEINT